MSDSNDPVLKALGIGWVHAEKNTEDLGPDSDAAYIEKAIAIQKAQARVISKARVFKNYTYKSDHVDELDEALAALDEVKK